MTSASQLQRHCGYPRALAKITTKSAKQQVALDKGTAFHSAVELWAKSGDLGAVLAGLLDDEVRGWVELLAMTWAPHDGMQFEVALGLGTHGCFEPVEEPDPHVYVARDGWPLLTAGRADVVWDAGDIVHVLDFKTGRYPVASPTENLQLTALALAAASRSGARGFIREIYYARDGYLDADPEPVMLDSDEGMAAWEMVEAAAKLDDAPRPGEWCEPCWERRLKRCDRAQVAA